jgi:hypothetical protein
MSSEDDAMDARLAQVLGPDADDTALLSRVVLTRLAASRTPQRTPLADVLVQPLPAAGLMFGLLLLAGATGYTLAPVGFDEVTAMTALFGIGF